MSKVLSGKMSLSVGGKVVGTVSGRIMGATAAMQTLTPTPRLDCFACEYEAQNKAEAEVHQLLCPMGGSKFALEKMQAELNEQHAQLLRSEYSAFPDVAKGPDLTVIASGQFGLKRKPGETDAELRFRLKKIILFGAHIERIR